MNKMKSNIPIGMDRKDLAIGRIVRLLPLLSVKELDAMGDRLGQQLRPVLPSFEATGATASPPLAVGAAKSSAIVEPIEACVDLA